MFNSSQNIYHRLVQRELGDFSSLGTSHLMKNMRRGNCSKTIFNGHQAKIIALDVQGYLAVTVCTDQRVNLWDLGTRKCQWTHNGGLRPILTSVLKIAGDCVIVAADEKIKMIDIATGQETVVIEGNDIDFLKIYVVGQSIFTGLSKGFGIGNYGIREWTIKGESKRIFYYEPRNSSIFPLFMGSSDFIIEGSETDLFIHQLKENKSTKFTFSNTIEEVHLINDKELICELNCAKQGMLNFCVINLETSQITGQFGINHAFEKVAGYTSIIFHKEWIYLGDAEGNLITTNVYNRSHQVFGRHSSQITYLAIREPLLMSTSAREKETEIKFWHLPSLRQISELKHPLYLPKIDFVFGKVLAPTRGSLIQWDYLVAHQGEKMTKETETEIKQVKDCVIQ